MKIDLTRYRRPVDEFSRSFPPEEVGSEPDVYRVRRPVDLVFEIRRDQDRFRLTGSVQTELELYCSRCLEPFSVPIDSAFDLRFLPLSAEGADGEREVTEDDLETSYYRDDEIDLNELIREQFYLAMPMKPLCSDTCRGLCPTCGKNLNAGTCSCPSSWVDPRFAALRDLRKDM